MHAGIEVAKVSINAKASMQGSSGTVSGIEAAKVCINAKAAVWQGDSMSAY